MPQTNFDKSNHHNITKDSVPQTRHGNVIVRSRDGSQVRLESKPKITNDLNQHSEYEFIRPSTNFVVGRVDEPKSITKSASVITNDQNINIPAAVAEDMKSWGSPKLWSDAQWQQLENVANSEITGEELMKVFGFKRRKDLEIIFYKLSQRNNKHYDIKWLTNYTNGEHALPDLKSNNKGLSISYARFVRHGFDVKPNTFFEFKRISDTEIILTIIG